MKNRCMTVEEVAELSNKTQDCIRDYLRRGIIKGTKIGKSWLVTKEEAYKFAGIKTDITTMKMQLRIKELECENRELKTRLDSFKVLASTLQSLLT